jgi:hypothetical protein
MIWQLAQLLIEMSITACASPAPRLFSPHTPSFLQLSLGIRGSDDGIKSLLVTVSPYTVPGGITVRANLKNWKQRFPTCAKGLDLLIDLIYAYFFWRQHGIPTIWLFGLMIW